MPTPTPPKPWTPRTLCLALLIAGTGPSAAGTMTDSVGLAAGTVGEGVEVANPAEVGRESAEIMAERRKLDETVWAGEVEAQQYEMVFINLWDRIRSADSAGKLAALAEFPFRSELSYGSVGAVDELDAGITLSRLDGEPTQTFDAESWAAFAGSMGDAGLQIIQTEWHHSRYVPAAQPGGPASTVSFAIHAVQVETQTLYEVRGNLEVQWTPDAGDTPVADTIVVTGLTLQQRSNGGIFQRLFTAQSRAGEIAASFPLMAYDLDGDGLSEIILPRWNRVYWNQGGRKFEDRPFLDHPRKIFEAGILADFDGDGNADFITVAKDNKPYFYAGTAEGTFPTEGVVCADITFDYPTTITAGDVDNDGDLDLWMAQYRASFGGGQMPTPFYDANDGHPSFFLKNDGSGRFVDETEASGLAELRHRRTYSSSFVDLDADGDLDLINVSDFAGLDLYRNNGGGAFELATDAYVDQRDFFGMGHTVGDYNQDGLLDFYVIGMSSTTARRLDRLNAGREDRPDVHQARATMGYGNRMYLGTPEGRFREDPELAAAVARTGWSWGATSFDFDLDGDLDVYVANGHRSGKSAQDYCTTFWRHDIYTGDSEASPAVLDVFKKTLGQINRKEISWNGYEKNVLFVNHPERAGRYVNSSFMFGSAYAFDARSVVSDDLDGDGWPDLLVAEMIVMDDGFASATHVFANAINTGEDNHWFAVRLRESAGPGFSPHGAKVTITDDTGRTQSRWIVSGDSFLAQHAPVAHFGLGKATAVTRVEVTWPNGETQRVDPGAGVDSAVTVRGGHGGE